MKTCLTRLVALGVTLAGSLSLGTFNALADLEVSAEVRISAPTDFYEPLGASGTWVEVGTYGRCWHPAHVAGEWRPYCEGTWVWTDCGWYWESDEPWAWACYHYGSWSYDSSYGWIWVPGVEWAPAWVYWRVGGGHIGWAPCAPHGVTVVSTSFVFVEERHFHERQRPSTVIVNNITIVKNTTEINASRRESRNIGGRQQTVVVNNGPDVNAIAKVTGKKIGAVSIREADRHTVAPPMVGHRTSKAMEKENAPVIQEQPKIVPEHKSPPAAAPEFPTKPAPSDKNLPPAKHEIIPPQQPSKHEIIPQQQPPLREAPAAHPSAPSSGNDNNPDQGRDKDKERSHERDKP